MGLPKLLITGSKGKIGTVLMKGLADSFEIYGLDLLESPTQRTFKADIADYAELSRVFQAVVPLPYIVHLAADPRVDAGWDSVLKNNIIGTRNLYEAAKECKVKRVVFASSVHTMGAYAGFPPGMQKQRPPDMMTVNDPVRPDSDYGTSKVFGETIARQYYERYGIQSVCLRIGTVLADDNPTKNERLRRMWLSHRDLIQLFKKSIFSEVEFGIYFGVSNNTGTFLDISNAREEIGYAPVDDASLF
jgi:nucleoside-diphosphate-sugar epimerase